MKITDEQKIAVQDDMDMLIHECDMLASRSWLTYEIPEDLMQRFKDNIDITSI